MHVHLIFFYYFWTADVFVNAVFDLCYSPELQKNALALLNALFTKASPEKKRVGAFPVQYLLVFPFYVFQSVNTLYMYLIKN